MRGGERGEARGERGEVRGGEERRKRRGREVEYFIGTKSILLLAPQYINNGRECTGYCVREMGGGERKWGVMEREMLTSQSIL